MSAFLCSAAAAAANAASSSCQDNYISLALTSSFIECDRLMELSLLTLSKLVLARHDMTISLATAVPP
jgi:hypothetical protein